MVWTILQIVWMITGPMGFVAMFMSACIHEKMNPIEWFEHYRKEMEKDEDFRDCSTDLIKIMLIIAMLAYMLIPTLGWQGFICDWKNIYHAKEPSN